MPRSISLGTGPASIGKSANDVVTARLSFYPRDDPAAMRAPPHHRPRARALLRHPGSAVVAVLVWLLGVELGPGLHIARHGQLDHHHHGASEALACAAHEDGMARPREHHATAGHHEHHATAGHHEHHAAAEHHGHHADRRGQAEHHGHHADRRRHAEHHGHHADRRDHAEDEGPDATEPDGLPVDLEPELADPPYPTDRAAHDHGSVPHGTSSLAHRDLVPLTPPLVLPPILSAPWRPVEVATILRVAPRERTPDVLRARGPPSGRPKPEPLSLA
jgi:hypothetical protein